MADSMKEGLSGMAKVGNPRQPMDRAALQALVNRSAEPKSARGTQRPKGGGGQTQDPGLFPTNARPHVLSENGGARYGTRVRMPAVAAVEAGPTQASGRLISGQQRGRSGPFSGGAAD